MLDPICKLFLCFGYFINLYTQFFHETVGADGSPRVGGPSAGDDWKNAFDAAANGPDPYSDSRGHSRRYSDDAGSGSNSSSRRTPTRLPPAPPGSYRY